MDITEVRAKDVHKVVIFWAKIFSATEGAEEK